MFQWHEYQHSGEFEGKRSRPVSGSGSQSLIAMNDRDIANERKDLAVDYLFCMVLIQVLESVANHPGYHDMIERILNKCFDHFKFKDDIQNRANTENINYVADMYAAVVGVLAKYRFGVVRKKFWTELKGLRSKEHSASHAVSRNIISLLMGMKCIRVQMAPIEELESNGSFVHELAAFFNEVKEKDIKHALAGLLVSILLPVAAVVKNEVNIPVMKQIVDTLWSPCIELVSKKKHSLALIPLVTCLLCISQKQFFLSNWPYFLSTCLGHLKSRDPQMSKISIESVFRLLWVYMVRIKGEKHTETQSRLQSIVLSIFPKGSKLVIPKETPINIFVRIIHLIAQEKFDFALKEIIYELLCVNRPKTIMPERMNIGLRAFLVIVHSMQQKEGEPPMLLKPVDVGTIKVKNSLKITQITDDTGKNLGIQHYLPQIRRSFVSIIRQLDPVVGRTLMLTKVDSDELSKTADERKQKLDLLKTCLGAIPRLLPNKEEIKNSELIEFLSRLLIHIDQDIKSLAQQALQNLIVEYPEWRGTVIRGVVEFMQREITDQVPDLFDQTLFTLAKLLQHWERSINPQELKKPLIDEQVKALHKAEALALIALCHPRIYPQLSTRVYPRKMAIIILKEVRQILPEKCPCLLNSFEKYINTKKLDEDFKISFRSDRSWLTATEFICNLELQKNGTTWYPTPEDPVLVNDPWISVMSGFLLSPDGLASNQYALKVAWTYCFDRLNAIFIYIDPNSPQNETRASSLLRSGRKLPSAEREQYIHLWHSYLVLCCCIAPSSMSDHLGDSTKLKSDKKSARDLVRFVVPLLRCELSDLRSSIISGLGRINSKGFKDCLDELVPLFKEANDRSEKVRRKKRRDVLKSTLLRILELAAECNVFRETESGLKVPNGGLCQSVLDFLEGIRIFFDREDGSLLDVLDVKMHFSKFITNLVNHSDKGVMQKMFGHNSKAVRCEMFSIMTKWLSKLNYGLVTGVELHQNPIFVSQDWSVDLVYINAMMSVLTCGSALIEDKEDKRLNILGFKFSRVLSWLDYLITHEDRQISKLSEDTICSLLNWTTCDSTTDSDFSAREFLEWLINKCYTSDNCYGYFRVILFTFTTQTDFPCFDISMICLALLFVGHPDFVMSQQAIQLFQLLYNRFYIEGKESTSDREMFYRSVPTLSLTCLSKQFSILHTQELTLSIYSEFTRRCETAKTPLKQIMFKILLPWLEPVELNIDRDSMPSTCGGYGTTEASEMILNNLLYMTHLIGNHYPFEVELMWQTLTRSNTDFSNLKSILRYLLAVTSLSPETLLCTTRKIAVYVARKEPNATVDELLSELRCLDDRGSWFVERLHGIPFFKYGDRSNQMAWSDKYATLRAYPGPKPLDMPPYGGYFAPLDSLLTAEVGLPSTEQFFHSAVSILLLSDIIRDQPSLEWRSCVAGVSEIKRLPNIFHAAVLAMDHQRPMVHYEARKVLLSFCSIVCANADVFRQGLLKLSGSPVVEVTIKPSPSLTTLTPDQLVEKTLPVFADSVTKQFVDLLLKDFEKPLFYKDDAYNPRTQVISASVTILSQLVQHLCGTLGDLSEWAEYALVAGLSCASRHYAGRSLQIFRALSYPLSFLRLADLTQRLIETISEPGEDQYYVRELLMTLESTVQFLTYLTPPNQQARSPSPASTISNDNSDVMMKSSTAIELQLTPKKNLYSQHHTRSTSYTAGISHTTSSSRHHRTLTETDLTKSHSGDCLPNKKSTQLDERFPIFWWISVCLLESELENELSLCLRIFKQLLSKLNSVPPPRLRFDWPDYPGLIKLVTRVCSYSNLFEPAYTILCSTPGLIQSSILDPQGPESAYASLTLQLLPYFLLHYDDSLEHCQKAASELSLIGQQLWAANTCQLIIVLQQYSRHSFTRDACQWCKCVCRYLVDAFPSLGQSLLKQIIQQLDNCPQPLLQHFQNIVHSLLSAVDLTESLSTPLIKILNKQVAQSSGDVWRVQSILKHLVFKSSCVPPASQTKVPTYLPMVPLPEAEPPRRELPGRTLNFTYDVKAEEKIKVVVPAASETVSLASTTGTTKSVSAQSDTPSTVSSDSSGDKRSITSGAPHIPSVRVRLVALCAAYFGARAGLPKSPSDAYLHKVIFSQSTETIDRQGSVHSSSDTTSTNDQSDEFLLDDSSSSELKYYNNIVGFIDDHLGFLNIEDPDSPTHPSGHNPPWGVPFYKDKDTHSVSRVPTSRSRESSSSSSEEEDDLELSSLPQREPATGASLSPSSAPSVSPLEEVPGSGETEWLEYAAKATSMPVERLCNLYHLWPAVVLEASEKLSCLCSAARPWLPAQLADPLCRLADNLASVSTPFVFISPSVAKTRAESERYVLLQLRERFETFRASRNTCSETVFDIGHSMQVETQQQKLANLLNRLCLQTRALHEAYAKAVEQLPLNRDANFDKELKDLRGKLKQAKFSLGPGSLSAPPSHLNALECLMQSKYQEAIKLMDMDQLLRVFCEYQAQECGRDICVCLLTDIPIEEKLRELTDEQILVSAALQELESADSSSL